MLVFPKTPTRKTKPTKEREEKKKRKRKKEKKRGSQLSCCYISEEIGSWNRTSIDKKFRRKAPAKRFCIQSFQSMAMYDQINVENVGPRAEFT
jgi:IS5 family transposase